MREEGLVDEIESYHRTDAERFQAIYRPNGVDPGFVLGNDVPYRERLYSFVGYSSRTRSNGGLSTVNEVIKKLYPKLSTQLRREDGKSSWWVLDSLSRIC